MPRDQSWDLKEAKNLRRAAEQSSHEVEPGGGDLMPGQVNSLVLRFLFIYLISI